MTYVLLGGSRNELVLLNEELIKPRPEVDVMAVTGEEEGMGLVG